MVCMRCISFIFSVCLFDCFVCLSLFFLLGRGRVFLWILASSGVVFASRTSPDGSIPPILICRLFPSVSSGLSAISLGGGEWTRHGFAGEDFHHIAFGRKYVAVVTSRLFCRIFTSGIWAFFFWSFHSRFPSEVEILIIDFLLKIYLKFQSLFFFIVCRMFVHFLKMSNVSLAVLLSYIFVCEGSGLQAGVWSLSQLPFCVVSSSADLLVLCYCSSSPSKPRKLRSASIIESYSCWYDAYDMQRRLRVSSGPLPVSPGGAQFRWIGFSESDPSVLITVDSDGTVRGLPLQTNCEVCSWILQSLIVSIGEELLSIVF